MGVKSSQDHKFLLYLPNGSSPEVGNIYWDFSSVTNIEGFLAYRCIYVVYCQPLSEVYRWCCVDDKNFIPIIFDVVLILVNQNLIPSPCPVCNQIHHQEPATTFHAWTLLQLLAGKLVLWGKLCTQMRNYIYIFYNADTVADL